MIRVFNFKNIQNIQEKFILYSSNFKLIFSHICTLSYDTQVQIEPRQNKECKKIKPKKRIGIMFDISHNLKCFTNGDINMVLI